jgi:hypothetical protein
LHRHVTLIDLTRVDVFHFSTSKLARLVERYQSGGSLLKHATSCQKDCGLNVSTHFAISQIIALSQLRDTHSGGDAFDGKLDTLQCSSLTLIALNDFPPDLGKFLFDFDHQRITNLYSQDFLRTVLLDLWRERSFKDVGAKGAAYVPPGLSPSRGRAVNRGDVLERFLRDQLTNVSNWAWQSRPRNIL